ncbi:MAG: DUF1553 domain-containing protein [Limisphaerales bacterium]
MLKPMRWRWIIVGLLLAIQAGTGASPDALRHFERRIRPLLVRYCGECHGKRDREGDLTLTTVDGLRLGGRTGAVIRPGETDGSRLVQAIRYTGKLKMPPDRKLPERVIAELTKWVQDGAVMPASAMKGKQRPEAPSRADASHWSFQPIRDPQPPRTKQRSDNAVDRFIRARLDAEGIIPNEPATRTTLIRRLAFDLTGLPPTSEEWDAFVNDRSPNAYARLVDRLLASPHYGERWGRHWLDAARYADSNGGGFDYIYQWAYHYRDYVLQSLNADKPYDRFVVEQLAGDLMPAHPDPDSHLQQLKATGFLTLAPKGLGEQDKVKMLMDVVDDEIDVVGRSLMGLTLACARCHDHKFDPIPTTDYYALAGIFRSTELVSNRDKNPSYWPERQIDHPRHQASREARTKRLTDKNVEIARLIQEAEGKLSTKSLFPRPVAHWSFDDQAAKGNLGRALECKSKRGVVTLSPSEVPRLDFGKTNDFSVSIWLRAAKDYAPETADSIVSARYGKRGMWFIALRSGAYQGIYLRHYDGKRTTDIKPSSNLLPKLVDGGWHHVAFTSDRNGRGIVYVDGQSRGSVPIGKVSSQADFRGLEEFKIGASVNAFRGRLDDPAIWDRVLTTSEVQQLYAAGKKGRAVNDLAPDLERRYPPDVKERLAALRDQAAAIRAEPITQPMTAMVAYDAAKPTDLRVHIAGDPKHLGATTRRGFPGIIRGPRPAVPSDSSSGRLELARWITDPRHPLTARVIVNRVWQHHFGDGLVRTPDNFGWLGEKPSHPNLLDWLATRFMEDGWSLKALHRRIVLSATYRQSSAMNASSHARDSGNQLLWRMNRRRLEAEPIRDALLMLAGKMDRSMFGTFQTWKAKSFTVDDKNRKTANYDTSRRSIYLPVVRDAVHPMLSLFDYGDPNSVVSHRTTTTGAPQALYLMNNEFVDEMAAAMARRLPDADAKARINTAYRWCFARNANPDEAKRALRFLKASGGDAAAWKSLCQGLFAMNEFIYVN